MRLQEADDVIAGAFQFIRDHVTAPALQKLLIKAVEGLDAQIADDKALLPFVHLPLAVYAALRGERAPARNLAVATTLLFLGIDILDDIQDNDLPDHWVGYDPAEIHLVAATLLSSLPQLAISRLPVLPATKARMVSCLSDGLLRMSGGQLHDLRTANAQMVTPEAVEESVIHKSGEEFAIIAGLAAHMAGASDETARLYGEFGRAMGTAGQLASDCFDIFQARHSKDLANGTRCLPIAVYLGRLEGQDRAIFLQLLDRAKEDVTARESIRRNLRAKGVLRLCAFVVEMYCQRARGALNRLELPETSRAEMDGMTKYISFYSKGG